MKFKLTMLGIVIVFLILLLIQGCIDKNNETKLINRPDMDWQTLTCPSNNASF